LKLNIEYCVTRSR